MVGDHNTVSGGSSNLAVGDHNTVSGGTANRVLGADSANNVKPVETGPIVVVSGRRVIADQSQLDADNVKLDVEKAIRPRETPIDLQRGSSDSSSSGTPSRAEADSLFATMGIARTFQLDTGTGGRDKVADFLVRMWGTLATAGAGGPLLVDRNIDARAAVDAFSPTPPRPGMKPLRK